LDHTEAVIVMSVTDDHFQKLLGGERGLTEHDARRRFARAERALAAIEGEAAHLRISNDALRETIELRAAEIVQLRDANAELHEEIQALEAEFKHDLEWERSRSSPWPAKNDAHSRRTTAVRRPAPRDPTWRRGRRRPAPARTRDRRQRRGASRREHRPARVQNRGRCGPRPRGAAHDGS
jgi:hypothetical protein